jgi:hypothetical protein
MNASDIIGAPGLSPGIVTAITTNTTYNYIPSVNVEVTLLINVTSSTSSVGVNGIAVASNTSGAINLLSVKFNVAKGQTAAITTANGAQILVNARSIQ